MKNSTLTQIYQLGTWVPAYTTALRYLGISEFINGKKISFITYFEYFLQYRQVFICTKPVEKAAIHCGKS